MAIIASSAGPRPKKERSCVDDCGDGDDGLMRGGRTGVMGDVEDVKGGSKPEGEREWRAARTTDGVGRKAEAVPRRRRASAARSSDGRGGFGMVGLIQQL